MAALYHSLFTEKGLELLRESIQNGTKLGITHMSFGDGGGMLPIPDAKFTQMINEVYRVALNRLAPSNENPNWLEADGVIPSAIGGFNIREVGLWAGNIMVAYANYPPTYKPSGDQGTAQIKTIRIVLQIDNTANFELKIDASVVMATIQAVEDAKIDVKKYADETKVHVVESISDLINLEKWEGRTVYVKSYLLGLNKGGGEFTYYSNRENENDGGLVINGWVRALNGPYILADWFGCYADGKKDDWQALTNCFQSITRLNKTINDANVVQWNAKTATFVLGIGIYRYTKPLMLPAMADVICVGSLMYFPVGQKLVQQNNRSILFYDGNELEASAIYLPVYINNNNGTWTLNENSLFMGVTGGSSEKSMAVGCTYKFNLITRRNTKIGFNAFGFESSAAEVSIGTQGTYAPNQDEAAAMQSQDYLYDDYSPRVGVSLKRAWNSKFIRPRIIAHNTGMYIGGGTAKVVIDTPYINRQIDKHTDAIDLKLDFLPVGIINEKSTTSAFVIENSDCHLIDPVTEHWGIPYTIASSSVLLDKPHVEGSNLVMKHDFVVYNSKVTVNDWSSIRTMYGRQGTSVIYSCGMDNYKDHIFKLQGGSYYADNSGYILIDGTGFDARYNSYFLTVENIPRDKIMGNVFFTESRYIKAVTGLRENFYGIYINSAKTSTGFGVSEDTALPNLTYLNEAIRLLGPAWNGTVNLSSDLAMTSDVFINNERLNLTVNMNNKIISVKNSSIFLTGDIKVSFYGTGTLKAEGESLFKTPLSNRCFNIDLSFGSGITFDTTNYIYRNFNDLLNVNLRINNSNLTKAVGKYIKCDGAAIGTIGVFVKSSTRNTAYDTAPVDFVANNFLLSSKIS
ncbi:phage tail protein [Acinetobacter baumannii]|uniref:phage tail protein n=1 Tax=Acinetobacter baumannii TaxID=470 RepID=UPI0002BA4A7C|nr:phage tail protein [Acinetobacter baumannii]